MGNFSTTTPKSIIIFFLFLTALPTTSIAKETPTLDVYIWSVDKERLKPAMSSLSMGQIKVSATYDSKKDSSDAETFRVTFSRALKLMERKENLCFLNVKKTQYREEIASFSKHPVFFFSLPELMILKSEQGQYSSEVDLRELAENQKIKVGVIPDISYDPRLTELVEQHPESFYTRGGSHQLGNIFGMIRHQRLDATFVFSSWLNAQHREGNYLDFISLSIKGIDHPEPGYLLCSDTPTGNQIINDFDRAYLENSLNEMVIENANQMFKPSQSSYVEKTLETLIGSQHLDDTEG